MRFMFLDLEYNQDQCNNIPNDNFIQFEIIQIGFIKTNVFLNPTNTYNTYISLGKYNNMNPRITKLTGITNDMLIKKGVPFSQAMNYFKQGVADGGTTHIITWGNDDIPILRDNCIKKNINCDFLDDVIWVNAQLYYSQIRGIKDQVSLTNASSNSDAYTHHNALYDVCRLIDICKREGILNVIRKVPEVKYVLPKSSNNKVEPNKTSKDSPKVESNTKVKSNKKKFRNYRFCRTYDIKCECGNKLGLFMRSGILEEDDFLEESYLFKCKDCSRKYFANTNLTKTNKKFVLKIDEVNIKTYLNKVDIFLSKYPYFLK